MQWALSNSFPQLLKSWINEYIFGNCKNKEKGVDFKHKMALHILILFWSVACHVTSWYKVQFTMEQMCSLQCKIQISSSISMKVWRFQCAMCHTAQCTVLCLFALNSCDFDCVAVLHCDTIIVFQCYVVLQCETVCRQCECGCMLWQEPLGKPDSDQNSGSV